MRLARTTLAILPLLCLAGAAALALLHPRWDAYAAGAGALVFAALAIALASRLRRRHEVEVVMSGRATRRLRRGPPGPRTRPAELLNWPRAQGARRSSDERDERESQRGR